MITRQANSLAFSMQLAQAFTALGNALLSQPQNAVLRQHMQSGGLSAAAYYTQLRHLASRLLVLVVAEARGLLPAPGASRGARQRYQRSYALGQAPYLAAPRRTQLRYQRVLATLGWLSGNPGGSEAAVPSLAAFLAPAPRLAELLDCSLPDAVLSAFLQAFIGALRSHPRLPDSLGEINGDVVEYLYLAAQPWQPVFVSQTCTWQLLPGPGTATASAGSRGLAPELLERLLDSALEPVVQEALTQPEPEAALLALKICDPACGTGTVLRAAARRLAGHLARLRGTDVAAALPDVVQRCLYGVDRDAASVDLCRVGLALEVLAPGCLLTSLDQHIGCGDSLLGSTPALLAQGIPEQAFRAVADDSPSIALALRQRNQHERQGQMRFNFAPEAAASQVGQRRQRRRRAGSAASPVAALLPGSETPASLLAHAWCAAFVWPKTPQAPAPITHDTLCELQLRPERVPPETRAQITQLARQYGFWHWHLAFPQVFTVPDPAQGQAAEQPLAGWSGGFDVLLGRLPWGTPCFASQDRGVTGHPGSTPVPTAPTRRRQQEAWCMADPLSAGALLAARQQAARRAHLLRYTAAGSPRKTAAPQSTLRFIAWGQLLLRPSGRLGYLLPVSNLLREDGFIQGLVQQQALVSFASVSNAARLIPWLPRTALLGLLTLSGSQRPQSTARVVWQAPRLEELAAPASYASLQHGDFALLNPNTRAYPALRSAGEAAVLKRLYSQFPILQARTDATPPAWEVQGSRMFQLTHDAALLRTPEQLEAEGWRFDGERFRHDQNSYLPVYEGSMLEALSCPTPQRLASLPRYWVPAEQVLQRTAHVPEALLQAYAQKRPDDILSVLASWLGGHHLNLGHQTCNRASLVQTYNPMFQGLPLEPGLWAASPTLARRWPLTPEDLRLIRQQHDVLLLARQLITQRCPHWLLSWRERLDSTYAVPVTLLPRAALAQSAPWLRTAPLEASLTGCLVANLASLVMAFCVRQKLLGTRLTPEILEELPVIPASTYTAPCAWDEVCSLQDWLIVRLLALLYTGPGLAPWARACGYEGPPLREEADSRDWYRHEIEAAYCHLYGLSRSEVCLLLDNMPQSRSAERPSGNIWLAGERLLQCYDALHTASCQGITYRPQVTPPELASLVSTLPASLSLTDRVDGFRRLIDPPPEERYKTCVPLLDMQAVVNACAEGDEIEPEIWIVVPPGRSLRPGMFVARMMGSGMAPQIPDRAYCLFERQGASHRQRFQGRIVLVQHPAINDPDIDGSYTVRRYVQEQPGRARRNAPAPLLRLLPLHADYPPIVLTLEQSAAPQVIAEFLSVLDEAWHIP